MSIAEETRVSVVRHQGIGAHRFKIEISEIEQSKAMPLGGCPTEVLLLAVAAAIGALEARLDPGSRRTMSGERVVGFIKQAFDAIPKDAQQ